MRNRSLASATYNCGSLMTSKYTPFQDIVIKPQSEMFLEIEICRAPMRYPGLNTLRTIYYLETKIHQQI
jgi:hypothetical protein